MPERDRIERIEYQLATVARQIAGMPVRIARSGGGSGRLAVSMMVLTEAIAAATGDTASITPAEALAQPYSTDSSGVRTPSGDPVTIRNYDTCQGWPARTLVYVGGDMPEIVAAACCQLDEGA